MNKENMQAMKWLRSCFPVAVLVVPLLILTVYTDLFGSVLVERIVVIMFINLAMTLALQVYMGNSGVSSFGHVGFMLMGAYGSILLTLTPAETSFTLRLMPTTWWIHDFHLPFFPAQLVTGLVVTVIGGLVGVILMQIGRTAAGWTSFALLIVIRILALTSEEITNGAMAVVGIPHYTTLWYTAGWGLFFVMVAWLFKESGLGLRLRASREDERAAATFGINIVWVRLVAWALSVFMTTIAGVLWAHFITAFTPHAFWTPTAFLIMVMLIIGGRASVAGAVVGTVVVTLISEGLRVTEFAINIQRVRSPVVARIFSQQVRGLNEFVLAIALLLILIVRPAGITKGREFSWPFGRRQPRESVTQMASTGGRADSVPANPNGAPGCLPTDE